MFGHQRQNPFEPLRLTADGVDQRCFAHHFHGRRQCFGVGAVQTNGSFHHRLNILHQPHQVVRFLVRMGAGIHIQPVRAGIGLFFGQLTDKLCVFLYNGLSDALAGTVDFFTDDFHSHPCLGSTGLCDYGSLRIFVR